MNLERISRPTHLRLREKTQEILDAFVEVIRVEIAAARRESKSLLIDSLPLLLEQLELKLRAQAKEVADEKVEEAGRMHAEQRIQATNFSLSDVLSEYHILRQIIFQMLLQDGRVTPRDTEIINSVIDRGVAHAGQHYIELTASKLTESQEHFRLLVEGTFEYAIFMLSPEGIVQTWNKGAERIKGYKGEEIIGKHFSIFYPPLSVEERHPDHELIIAAKEGKFEEEGIRLRKNGTAFLAHVVINALRDEKGLLKGYSKVTHDLTERKIAEENFRSFANAITQLAWMADERGWVNWFNDQWYEFTGKTFEDMQGWGWQSVQNPEEVEAVAEQWSRSIKTGNPFEMVLSLRSVSGEYRSFQTSAVPFKDAEGRIIKWFGTNTDIQSQKDIQEELAKANSHAQDALRARDEFISIASHELKTPLTSLLLQMQLRSRKILKGELKDLTPQQMTKMIETDQRQLNRITRLIDDMLDVSKISSGNLSVTFERFNICALSKEILITYREIFESFGAKVSLVCEGEVEGPWDRFRIEQAIVNLLMNACKYGCERAVLVRVKCEGRLTKLSVEDHGMGIAPENIERVFERFERAVRKSEVSGLGLGLFITKQIVLAHRGHIHVDSVVGQGSVFTMELPLD